MRARTHKIFCKHFYYSVVCHGGVWGELQPKDSLNIRLPLHSAGTAEVFLNDDDADNDDGNTVKVLKSFL